MSDQSPIDWAEPMEAARKALSAADKAAQRGQYSQACDYLVAVIHHAVCAQTQIQMVRGK
jgi:hypothetical protein